MAYPFKDYEFYGDRYVNSIDTHGEIMWYERDIDRDAPTECMLCIEAENEMYTKYAHPKAHVEAHTQATITAETLAIKEKNTDDYLDYYTFHYGREYIKIYKELYKKYKEEYSSIVLERQHDRVCQHHQESIQYHYELQLRDHHQAEHSKEEDNSVKHEAGGSGSAHGMSHFKESAEEDLGELVGLGIGYDEKY